MGHLDGLSHGRGTYRDFMGVICKYVERYGDELDPESRHQILLRNFVHNARGLIVGGWYRDGNRLRAGGGAPRPAAARGVRGGPPRVPDGPPHAARSMRRLSGA